MLKSNYTIAAIAFFVVLFLSAAFLVLPVFKDAFSTAVQMPPIPNNRSAVFMNVTFDNGTVGFLNRQLLTEEAGNTIIAAVNAIINGQLDLNDIATAVTDEEESTADDGGGGGGDGGSNSTDPCPFEPLD